MRYVRFELSNDVGRRCFIIIHATSAFGEHGETAYIDRYTTPIILGSANWRGSGSLQSVRWAEVGPPLNS